MALIRKKPKKQTVTFPLSIFETADTKEDLEDWLLSQNPEFQFIHERPSAASGRNQIRNTNIEIRNNFQMAKNSMPQTLLKPYLIIALRPRSLKIEQKKQEIDG